LKGRNTRDGEGEEDGGRELHFRLLSSSKWMRGFLNGKVWSLSLSNSKMSMLRRFRRVVSGQVKVLLVIERHGRCDENHVVERSFADLDLDDVVVRVVDFTN
jgi:hypothetical protein